MRGELKGFEWTKENVNYFLIEGFMSGTFFIKKMTLVGCAKINLMRPQRFEFILREIFGFILKELFFLFF